jgi:hypothetical protein
MTESAQGISRSSSHGVAKRFSLQDSILFKHLDWAIKESIRFDGWNEFIHHVEEQLPFRAQATRKRSLSVIAQAFPNRSLDSLPALAWRRYQDDRLLNDLSRATLLLEWPPGLGRFVSVWLTSLQPGSPVTDELRDSFLATEPLLHDPRERLLSTMRALGFLRQVGRGRYVVAERLMSRTAFWLMLLHRFAPEPSTVPVADVLADPFWRYLGGREERDVREAMAAAERGGLLRHERVDQLDQIATRLSLAETLDLRVRL